jgi:TetR/AcrR family transcriptional regulator, transcriptional repressor for nem operon
MEGYKKIMRHPVEETAAKHERIVKEASRLFRERGFQNVSVGEVMKAAGQSRGKRRRIRKRPHPC